MVLAEAVTRDGFYRTTRQPSEGVYYTLAATSKHDTVEKARAHHVGLLEKRGSSIVGRESWVLGRLSAGWVPMYRHTRRYDADGRRVEDRELTAVPPDTRLRAVSSKPGYRGRKGS